MTAAANGDTLAKSKTVGILPVILLFGLIRTRLRVGRFDSSSLIL